MGGVKTSIAVTAILVNGNEKYETRGEREVPPQIFAGAVRGKEKGLSSGSVARSPRTKNQPLGRVGKESFRPQQKGDRGAPAHHTLALCEFEIIGSLEPAMHSR